MRSCFYSMLCIGIRVFDDDFMLCLYGKKIGRIEGWNFCHLDRKREGLSKEKCIFGRNLSHLYITNFSNNAKIWKEIHHSFMAPPLPSSLPLLKSYPNILKVIAIGPNLHTIHSSKCLIVFLVFVFCQCLEILVIIFCLAYLIMLY